MAGSSCPGGPLIPSFSVCSTNLVNLMAASGDPRRRALIVDKQVGPPLCRDTHSPASNVCAAVNMFGSGHSSASAADLLPYTASASLKPRSCVHAGPRV